MASLRRGRVKAAKRALGAMTPKAASLAQAKARGTGRVYPTSGQRARAKKRT
jgi:hypothetical protein